MTTKFTKLKQINGKSEISLPSYARHPMFASWKAEEDYQMEVAKKEMLAKQEKKKHSKTKLFER